MLNRIGREWEGGVWGGALAFHGHNGAPRDITLPPAVMSEATTMDLPRQMAPGMGRWGMGWDTCVLGTQSWEPGGRGSGPTMARK